MVIVLFALIGILSIFIGIIAEILNRTYHEAQNKPIYLIKEYKNIKKQVSTK